MKKILCSIIALVLSSSVAFGQLESVKTIENLKADESNIAVATVLDSLFFQNLVKAIENRSYNNEDFTTFALALTATTADSGVLVVSSNISITTNTTISGQLSVQVNRNGRFNITSGDTLTFADSVSFDAGDFQVFEGAGEVRGLKFVKTEWFGAKGDGSTDNAVAIQKAADSFSTGAFVFGVGTYIIEAAIDFNETTSNITMSGIGPSTILKIKNSVDLTSMFTFTNLSNVTVKDLTFDTNQANQTAGQDKALTFAGCTNVRVLDNTFTGGNSTTGSPESVNVGTTNIFIFKGNTSLNEENHWVILSDVDNFVISGNIRQEDCSSDAGSVFSILALSSSGAIFGNIMICPGGAGMFIDDPANGGNAPENFTILGNIITGADADAILLEQAPFAAVVGNVIINDHPVLDGDTGISLGSLGNLAVGNVIKDRHNVGIALFDNGKTDQSQVGKLAVANIILNTGTGNPTVESRQIWLDDAIRNVVGLNAMYSLNTPNNTNYGVRETGTAEDNLILGNLSYRDSTAGISAGGESTIAFNMITTTATTVDSSRVIADNMSMGAFKQIGDIDADTFGGHKTTVWFQLENVPANTTTDLIPWGNPVGHNGYQMLRSGSVIGCTYRSTATVSAGTLEININVEGSDTGFGVSPTGVSANATQAKDTDTFVQNQRIQVEAVADASFAPATMDIIVGVEIEY